MRPNLVFVRAGDDSLHPEWIREDANRNWDCFVSYYGPTGRIPDGAEYFETGGNNKFQHFKTLCEDGRLDPSRYDYIMLADSDLSMDGGEVSRLFTLIRENGLDLAQASLHPKSYTSHRITLHSPHYTVRRTNFVEVMCPVFSRAALQTCLDSFDATVSTWGLDIIWPHRLAGQRLGIVDAIQFTHARPIDTDTGPWYRRLREMGVDARAEGAGVLETLGIDRYVPRFNPLTSRPVQGKSRVSAYLAERRIMRRIRSKIARVLGLAH